MKKVGILTFHYSDNYGAVLQAYALRERINRIPGYECDIINYIPEKYTYSLYQNNMEMRNALIVKRELFDAFLREYCNVKEPVISDLQGTDYDVYVVGSDQVWRPSMNLCLEDMYLKFAKNESIHKRIAYSASFGIDKWEYTPTQTEKCSALVKMFNAVSVREESGVELCKKNFDIDVTWVLDPTLLLEKSDYMKLCEQIPVHLKKYLAVYVLEMNDSIRKMCDEIASEKGLVMKFFSADASAILSVPEWLAMFRDASYIITDSFHGTVFSIIFGKEFKCFYNKKRGAARFKSLLGLYNSEKIEEMRDFSLNWLKNALQ